MSPVGIGIIGGGISGLAVALRASLHGASVTLFEANSRLGGQLWSEQSAGFLVEHGAEGFVARSLAAPRLAELVGLSSELCAQLEPRSFEFDGACLLELEPGEAARRLGFQVPASELGRGIRSLIGGMSSLSEAVVRALAGKVTLRPASLVRRARPRAGGRIQLGLDSGECLEFDRVVVATEAYAAGALLAEAFGEVASALGAATTVSSLTVTLGFDEARLPGPLVGSGFVVREGVELHGVRAAAFSSAKLTQRASPGQALVRFFFRPALEELHAVGDDEWVARATGAARSVLGFQGDAPHHWVSRWPAALPIFDAERRARVSALEAALEGSGLLLTGSAFHGSGIDAALRSAEVTSDRLALALDVARAEPRG